MRRSVVAANWKMHGSPDAVQRYLERLVAVVEAERPATEVVVCPPFTAMPAALAVATGSPVAIGAQNCHWEEKGAFTGEVSASMLAEQGARWVIVGHSERRQYFGETDATAAARATAAQRAGLEVIYCLGETLEQREAGETLAVLERQGTALSGLDPARFALAYEPVWAIGTGRNATPEQAQQAHAFLRGRLAARFGAEVAAAIPILYGGSVKPDNVASLLGQADVDGALVGGASLDVEAFSAIIRCAPGRGPAAG